MTMSTPADRLDLFEDILTLIARKRAETHDRTLGASIERVVIDSQVEEIEREIFEDPGVTEPWLMLRRGEA
jgi:hypothetical protein